MAENPQGQQKPSVDFQLHKEKAMHGRRVQRARELNKSALMRKDQQKQAELNKGKDKGPKER